MKDILQEIIASKRLEVEEQKRAVDLRTLISTGSKQLSRPVLSMRTSLEKSATGIIAEFKRKSPSKGWLFPEANVSTILPAYESAGASACSILTDSKYFGGSLSDLQQARKSVNLPLLRKDFIIDEYQLYQARIMGADAILLIAAALNEKECFALSETAHSIGLEILLEIHTGDELNYLNPNIDMLGVNNRNLGSFHTDTDNSFRLIEQMRIHTSSSGFSPLMISESGISDPAVVKQLRSSGFQGFLIGETFMRTHQPDKSLAEFIGGLS
jgi:indole-3-glycerol phosphate synthase